MTRPGSVFSFGMGATGQLIPAMAAWSPTCCSSAFRS